MIGLTSSAPRLGLTLAFLALASAAEAFFDGRALDPYWGTRALDIAEPDSGPLAPDAPNQADLAEEFDILRGGYTVRAVQGFGIEALVLSRHDYAAGDLGALVPMDLALAWGRVSDPAWVKHLRVTQSERVYRWSYPRGTDLEEQTVIFSSANMHVMPATLEIEEQLSSIGRGDVVRISGFLVDITKPDGFSWLTSRTRTDTGLGACEIILVERVEIEGRK